MRRDELVARARSVIGKGCHYKLGHGGKVPTAVVPWDGEMLCDCSGFIAWALGENRHTDDPWYRRQNGGWLETTAIVADCATSYGLFNRVDLAQALPGDLIVYSDHENSDGTKRQGHVGIIAAIDSKGPTLAVHCSSGNDHKAGDAIQETGVGLWLIAGGIIARCGLVEHDVPPEIAGRTPTETRQG